MDLMGRAGGGVITVLRNVGSVALSVAGNILKVAVVAGAALGVTAVKAAEDFQAGLTSLVTGANETGTLTSGNLKVVGDGIKQLSVDTGESTKQLISGMYMIESGGYHGAAGLAILKAAAMGAKTSTSDLGVTADATDTILKNFGNTGISATQVVNGLVATVKHGKVYMQDLAGSLSQVLPTAAAAGVGLNDVEAAMSTMTAGGTKADQAATFLRQTLIALEAPSAKGAKALASVGLSTQAVADAMHKSLPGALQLITDDLKKKFPEGSAAYLNAIKDISGGSRTMQGMLLLTGQHLSVFKQNVDEITGAVKEGGGAINGWAMTQQNLATQVDRVKAAGHILLISIGGQLLPALTDAAKYLVPVVTGFSTWFDKTQPLTHALDGIGGALHQVQHFLSTFDFTFLTSGWKLFSDALGQAREVIQRTGVYLQPLQKMLGRLLTQGILDGIRIGGDLFRRLSTFINDLVQSGGIGQAVDWFRSLAGVVQNQLQARFEAFRRTALQVSDWFTSTMLPLLQGQVLPAFQNLAGVLVHNVAPAFVQVWQAGQNFSDRLLPDIASVLEHILVPLSRFEGMIASGLAPALSFLAPYAAQAGTALTGFAGDIADRVAPIINEFFDSIDQQLVQFQQNWNIVWPYLAPVATAVWDEIVGRTRQFFAIYSGIVKTMLDALSGNWKGAWKDIQDASSQFMEGRNIAIGQGTAHMKQTGSSNMAGLSSNVQGSMASMSSGSIGSMQTLSDTGSKLFAQMQQSGSSSMSKLDSDTVTYLNSIASYLDQTDAKIAAAKMPDKGKLLNKNIGYATGTSSAAPGLAWVGERGPELMAMAGGEIVFPHAASEQLAAGLSGLPPALKAAAASIAARVQSTAKGWSDTAGAAISSAAAAVTGGASGGGATTGTSVNVPGSLASWIAAAMALTGAPANWAGPLGTIAMKESGGNPGVTNTWDSNAAAGTPSMGLFQTIGPTFSAYAVPGHGNILNPVDNAAAAIRYIMARYGSVFNVPGIVSMAAGGGYVGYADGTTAATAGTALVGEAGRELVVRKKKTPVKKKVPVSTLNPVALALVDRFTRDVRSSAGTAHTDAERIMGSTLALIAHNPALIASAKLHGNAALVKRLQAESTVAGEELKLFETAVKGRGLAYNTKNLTNPIDFNPLNALHGTTSMSSGSTSGGTTGGMVITNNITISINARAANAQEVYSIVLKQLERDLKRSGSIITTPGGR